MLKNYIRDLMDELAIAVMTGGDVHQEASFGKLLFPGLRKIFYETYDEVPAEYSNIFHMETSNKVEEVDYGMGAMSPWVKFGNTYKTPAIVNPNEMPKITYQTIPAGLERHYIHEEFASGFAVERKYKDDEQYKVINKMPADLARAGRYKVETDAVSTFNNGFVINGYDAKPLFCRDHPLLKADAVTEYGVGICSNVIDGAFSFDTLKLATTMFRKQVDEAGKLIQMKPDTLVVPPSQEWLAYELLKTAQKPGGNLNDVNALMGKFKIVVWDFLTDDDAVYLMDSKRHKLNFFWRTKPEFEHENEFDTKVAKYSGYMRYSFGYSDWRGLVAIKDIA